MMSIRDKNVAIRSDRDSRRPIEGVRTIPGDSGLTERHQNFPIRTELEDLVALSMFACVITCGSSSDSVSHPNVSVLVHKEAVWIYEHPRSKILQKLA